MVLNLLAYIVIPIFTVLLALNAGIWEDNLSFVGNYRDKRLAFILWGALVSVYFFLCTQDIIKASSLKHKKRHLFFLWGNCLMLFTAVMLPYLPETYPRCSSYHIWFAFASCVFFILHCFYLLFYFARRFSGRYRFYFLELLSIALISAALLFRLGIVTSGLEIFFTVSMAIYLKKIRQEILLEEEHIL